MDEMVCLSSHFTQPAQSGQSHNSSHIVRAGGIFPTSLMRPVSRIVHALFAVWFALVLGDPGVLHACPMHGGHGAAHAATAEPAPNVSHPHAGHDAAASEHVSESAQLPGAPAPCTCVGHCAATPAALPLPLPATVQVTEVAAEVRRPPAAPIHEAPASPALRLPFANGPPTA